MSDLSAKSAEGTAGPRQIAPRLLPDQVYAHTAQHDIGLTADPVSFRTVRTEHEYGWVKPAPGTGLWTSPVTERSASGGASWSSWLEWWRVEMDVDSSGVLLTEIIPRPEARIMVVESQYDLIRIVSSYPSKRHPLLSRSYPCWKSMADDGWDAVYLTDGGQWHTRLPDEGPDLYGWDVESCLWLRHAYSVGSTTEAKRGGDDG